jgi:hypothetical protein
MLSIISMTILLSPLFSSSYLTSHEENDLLAANPRKGR